MFLARSVIITSPSSPIAHHFLKRLSREPGRGLELRRLDRPALRLDDLDRSAPAATIHRADRITLVRALPGGIGPGEPLSSLTRAARQLGHLGGEPVALLGVQLSP